MLPQPGELGFSLTPSWWLGFLFPDPLVGVWQALGVSFHLLLIIFFYYCCWSFTEIFAVEAV
jgi:hypothetical protein